MEHEHKRAVTAFVLVALALPFSMLAVSRIDHRTLFGAEGGAGSFGQLLAQVAQQPVAQGGLGGAGDAVVLTEQSTPVTNVQLLVDVLDDSSGSLHIVQNAPVNVTRMNPLASEILRGHNDVAVATGGPTIVATALTDRRGRATFELTASNYTIYAQDLGLTGNFSLTLDPSHPQVFLHWIFREKLETPALVQMSDQDADGLISPGEVISIFYQTNNPQKPQRIVLSLNGDIESSVDLTIVNATVFQNGVYLVASPVTSILIGDLGSNSTLLIGFSWYEATMTT